MEITILSAQGLKNTSFTIFSSRIRPFVTITTYPPATTSGDKHCHVYRTRVDDHGGVNPTWGDKFYVPTDCNAFFANRYACIYLQLYTKTLISGQTLLGWCQIPVNDIGFPPGGSVRNLSYRLRARDGSRGHGVVNLAIKLEPVVPDTSLDACHVIGIPLICQNRLGVNCEEESRLRNEREVSPTYGLNLTNR